VPIGGFPGWSIESLTDPRRYGNEIWDNIGYNSVCVRDFGDLGDQVTHPKQQKSFY